MAQFISDYFRAALVHLLSEKGRGAQTRLAIDQGIDRGYLNAIVKGRKAGSERVREKIACYFNIDYEKMLALGRRLEEVEREGGGEGSAKGSLPIGKVSQNGEGHAVDISEFIMKMIDILESDTSYSFLLKNIINNLHQTVGQQRSDSVSIKKVADLESKVSRLEARLGESLRRPV